MIPEITQFLDQLLGLGADSPNWYQSSVRALVIYIAALVMVRVGKKRFLGKNTAFDVILGIILGSVVSRAINGSAPFFLTILSGFVLVGAHWLFSMLAFRSSRFGALVKGSKRELIRDGEIQWKEMEKGNISQEDLLSQLRSEVRQERLDPIQKAYLERSGNISFIEQQQSPKILEVKVAEGVQTVRIQFE